MRNRKLASIVLVFVVMALVLSSCKPQVVKETVIVEKPVEKVVEKIVKETVIVEKPVEKVVKETVVVEKPVGPKDYGKVVVFSTQGVPVAEAEAMRNVVLAGFSGQADFVPTEAFLDVTLAEAKSGKGTTDVYISLHGDYPTLADVDALVDLSYLTGKLSGLGIPKAFMDLGKLGGDKQYYIPMMQATYIFAANKKALPYLPSGADVNALTWEQLRDWGKNIYDATGDKKLGFPAGEGGLMHRFLEGYIYPSYTGGMVTGFRTDDAVKMWEFFKSLWGYAHPQCLTYAYMQEQLLSEEVWVAFDHTARLINAFKERPDDFIAIPAPSGPKGLGFMPVIVGMAIPKTAPNPEGAEAMIEYILQPATQIAILREIGFFPVVDVDFPAYVAGGIRTEGDAVSKQAAASNALPALLPVGLGPRGGEINKIFKDAFRRIIIDGEDIAKVLKAEGDNLQKLQLAEAAGRDRCSLLAARRPQHRPLSTVGGCCSQGLR